MQEILLGLGLKRPGESEGSPFKGELIASPELLGTAIASQIGLTNGIAQHDDAGWLVFDFEGKTLLVAKRSLRHSVSWNQINAVNAVYGDRSIEINGESFKVRLLKGAASDPTTYINGHDIEPSWDSEWNRLFYPLVPNPTGTPTHPISQEGITYGEWANYTETELNIGSSGGNGRRSRCQESSGDNRVHHGHTSLSYFGLNTDSPGTGSSYGWRPVLELVRTTTEPQDLFLGEVSTDRLITGDALATQIGLTAGTAINSTEPWLQFLTKEGQILYVSKKPYRHSVSWDHIQARNAVYGDRTIEINGKTFKVRLLKGAASDPVTGSNGHDPEHTWGSEWNRLLYPLVPNPTNTPTHPISQEGIRYGAFANYTEAELNVGSSGGNGRITWCQESNGSTQCVRRGGSGGLSRFDLATSSLATSSYGWRPVLELVP